jgi:hypothetical protein
MSSVACSGQCNAGYACPARSTNSTAALCNVGRYSLAGAGSCTPCAPGTYGDAAAMASANCTAPCPAGTYGATMGLTTASCSGNCTAGYACVAGSTNSTAAVCSVGKYSLSGAGSCSDCSAGLYGSTSGLPTAACTAPCPAGTYGAVSGLASSGCSGQCTAGYACVAGSVSPTAAMCAAGQYSLAGRGGCVQCVSGGHVWRDDGSDDRVVQRKLHGGVRVCGRVDHHYGGRVQCGEVQLVRCRVVQQLQCGPIWQHVRTAHGSVHGPVSRRHVWSRLRPCVSCMLWSL